MGHVRGERGFTLIELILSILLLNILLLVVWELFGQTVSLWKQGEHKVDMHDSLRISLDRMSRELRYTQGITASSNSTNLYFKNDGGTAVRYYCSSYVLYRRVQNNVPQPLASDIESVGFTYYDSAGIVVDVASQAAAVRQVKIAITAAKPGSIAGPVVLVQKVSLRASR
ncbi:MAG: prepilin-type N-terminal cleavage/methylation domain-containing protein [Desulfotomaculaceae bacterium]|nr:prepilin-type N-terminal cleavage/methylation domain-containing protein [Desulfotomaculaceae bacterium]